MINEETQEELICPKCWSDNVIEDPVTNLLICLDCGHTEEDDMEATFKAKREADALETIQEKAEEEDMMKVE